MLVSMYAFVQYLKILFDRYSKKVLTAGLVLGAFAMFGFLIAWDWDILQKFRWHLSPSLLVLALCCHAASLAGTFVTWKLIMSHLGSPVGTRTDFYIYFLSLAARKMPSAIWYTGTRLLLYVREGVSASLVLTAIALEFGIAVVTGGWTLAVFRSYYSFMKHYEWVGHGILVLSLLLTTLLIIRPLLFTRWVQYRPAEQINYLPANMSKWKDLLICFPIYLAAWVIGGTSFYLTIRALIPNSGINWPDAVGVATVSTLVTLMGTVLPMGIGVKELTAGVLLSAWLPMPVGLAIAMTYRILQVLDEALWIGWAYLLRPKTPR